jgi:type I restriction enzyme S subunit
VWLGDIPEHWEVKRFKFLLSEPFKYGANEAAEIDDPNLPRYIRITDVKDDGNLRDDTFRSLPEEIAKDYILEESDILLARSGATVGKTFIYRKSWGKAAYAGYLIRARVSGQNNSNFIYKFLQSKLYWDWVKSIFIQATIQNISAEKYSNLFITIPPLNEQEKIAQFLDYKTKQIDELIKKKETLIEKLDEKRTAVISHAVTKGLDSSVPMKDSCIEWLGEIPKHWKVKRLKNIASCNDESLGENTAPDFEIEYVDISSVDLVSGIRHYENMTFEKAPSRARRKVQDGDTIISTVRTYLKSIAAIKQPPINLIVSTGFAVIRPKININSNYIGYLLQSEGFVGKVVSNSVGVSYPAINSSVLISLPVVEPPINEQQKIAQFLDYKTAQIDKQKAKIKQAIELLKEYRTSLITNAVTGKIDVSQVDIP